MPSGVVFVAILMIWAVILAPRVMRLYERNATQRTTNRFSSAMTVLGGGKAVARVAVDTARRGSKVVVDTRSPRVAPMPDAAGADGAVGPIPRRQHSRAVLRRRRAAVAGAGVVVVAVAAAVSGVLPWIVVPVAAVPLVAFLGACAATAGQRRDRRVVSGADPASTPAATPGTADAGVAPLPTRRARRSGLRAGSWTQARVLEADLAIAATYASTEERLGLDRYVASPSDVDGEPYLRAANE